MPIDKLSIPISGNAEQPTRVAFLSLQQQLDKQVVQINDGLAGQTVSAGLARSVTSSDAGKIILLNQADGSVVTLPTATGSGNVYRFMVSVVSTAHVIKVANATDIMQGVVYTVSDNTNAVLGWRTADDSDTITLNGTTTGGAERGEMFTLVDATIWLVNGFTSSTGTEATPFSATVS
jgi:hypothetical protein